MKLKKVLSEIAGTPLMKVISNPYAKAFAQVNEAEDDKYTHIGYGKFKEKGKEDNPDAPTFTKTDSGKYVPTSGSDSTSKDTKGGVNIFDKDYDAGGEKSQSSNTVSSDSDDEFEFLESFEMEEKLDSMDLEDDVKAELYTLIDYLQGQEYELENAREEEDEEYEVELEDDIARTRDEIGKIFKSAKKSPSKKKPSKEAPKTSSYSGDYQDMQKDMQNAFKSAGISNKVTSSFRFNDNHSQVHFEDEIDDDSLQSALDKFNQENGTNFQAGKVKRGPKGWYVAISEDPTHEKLQEHKNTSMKLKDLLTEEKTFTATNKETGNVSVFKSKASRDAAVKSGSHEMRKDDKEDGVEKPSPKVNIFKKDKEEPKKDEPVKDSSGGRAGNPQVNKATKKKAEELGITPSELGREEYEKTMIQAAVAALTDSNYHTEARELIAMIEDKPEWKEDPRKSAPSIDSPEYDEWRKSSVYSSEYYDADSATEELGQTASQEAGWNGVDALDGIAFELKTRGFVDLATKIQSVIKENKSTRLKDII